MRYAVHLYELGLKGDTIATKLSAVAYFHKYDLPIGVQPLELPTAHWTLRDLKRGINRRQGEAGRNVKRERPPLAWQQIATGRTVLNWRSLEGGGITVWYGLALLYILSARPSEIFSGGAAAVGSGGEYTLRRRNIAFYKGQRQVGWRSWRGADAEAAVAITFEASKADQARSGKTIYRSGGAGEILRELMELHPTLPATAPLTAYYAGGEQRNVTTTTALAALQLMLRKQQFEQAHKYTLHCGRIGAATRLANAGASDGAIMGAGRWGSTAHLTYVRQTGDAAYISDLLVPQAASPQPEHSFPTGGFP